MSFVMIVVMVLLAQVVLPLLRQFPLNLWSSTIYVFDVVGAVKAFDSRSVSLVFFKKRGLGVEFCCLRLLLL